MVEISYFQLSVTIGLFNKINAKTKTRNRVIIMIYINLEGRIGNNLWQVAAAATLAERLGEGFVAVPNPYYHCPEPDNCSFTDYIKPYKKTIFRNVRFEDTFPADCYQYEVEMDLKSIQSLPAKNVRLEGYFQNIHYVSERVIQHLFLPHVEMVTKLRAEYPMLDKKNTCAIVVRRGDYLRLPLKFPVEDKAYYRECMRIMKKRLHTKDIHYLVISDDNKWCKSHFTGESFTIVPHADPLTDLYVASLCKHQIISNSSFAQWGALLNANPNKIVLYPSPWMGIGNRRLDTHGEGMPQQWIQVRHYSKAYMHGVLLYLYYGICKHIKQLYKRLLNI